MYGRRRKGGVRKGERRWEKEKEGRGKDNAAHRETGESIVVARRVDVSTIETEEVRVRSIRISSS